MHGQGLQKATPPAGAAVGPASIERHYPTWLALLCLTGVGAAMAANAAMIAHFRFWDPDDVMRLVEVRDWLGGQSWFDVSQHRMNRPVGLSMHWSRLVDLPLAASILAFRPLLGWRGAETLAAVAVPMITLVLTMVLVAEITRRRSGAGAALLAAALCLLSISTWYAMPPMRIDHHGWQIVAGLALALAIAGGQGRRSAIWGGLCAAAWTHISLEGLAFSTAVAGWLGLLWIWSPQPPARLPPFLAVFAAAATLLYLGAHGTALIGRTFCDQMSPVHLAVLAAAALLTGVATLATRSAMARLSALAAIGMACAALYRIGAPQCAAGPFGTLGPLGAGLWYSHVYEGIPLWRISPDLALVWGVFPWIGLAGAVLTCRRSHREGDWAYAALLAAATMIGLFVTRAGAFANLLAIPGAVGLMLRLFARTGAWPPAARIAARTAGVLLLSPAGAQSAALLVPLSSPAAPPARAAEPGCGSIDRLQPLDRFAQTTVVAPLELGPNILAGTHHDAVTGPYHRDPDALEDLLRIFTASDAHAIATRHGAHLLVFCRTEGEMLAMARFAPAGLAARLEQDRPPPWLEPLPMPDMAGLRVYRILP